MTPNLEEIKKLSVGTLKEAEKASFKHGKKKQTFMQGFRFARNNLQTQKATLLKALSSHSHHQKERLVERVKASKYVFERPKEDYLPEVYKHLMSKNEAKDDIISLIEKDDNKS